MPHSQCFLPSSPASVSPSNYELKTPSTFSKLTPLGLLPSRPPSSWGLPWPAAQPAAATPRRSLFLSSASAIWDALTRGAGDRARAASASIRRGMQLFRQGDVSGSLAEFDRAVELDPRQKAYLWQRGLSLYYLDRFEEGAKQFRLDVAENPNDTEESIWCFLCEAQVYGADEARKRFVEVGPDPRHVMHEAYNMFKNGGDPNKLVLSFSSAGIERFYASLYVGLYYESQNKTEAAKLHIIAACQTPYGLRSDDYMASLAKVHCSCRNWSFN